jgi:type IV secretion system protein TrbG
LRYLIIPLLTASCLTLVGCPEVEARPIPYLKLAPAKTAPEVLPTATVTAANRAAVQEPKIDGYINAVQVYPFMEGAVFRLYTAPEKVSDIALQSGEQLIAISAGDTARWVIGDTYSGAGANKQVHILVKPYTSDLKTNLVITTNLRTYHLQLESTPATAMVALSWSYPQDALMVRKAEQAKAEAAQPVDTGVALGSLRFTYAITGDKPAWRPTHVFDDGQKVYIEFPQNLAQGEAPPLFVIGEGGTAELVNYRLQKTYYVVDRLFAVAELRLGGKRQSIVRIARTDRHQARAFMSVSSVEGGHD